VGVSQAALGSRLSDAFNNGLNVTTSDPGKFKSQVRSSVMLGSGRMRFGNSSAATPLGINIVPPSLDIGCNGIDWHFGGLSWINGENMERMLKAAGPAALMYIVSLAINALCEDCANVLHKVIEALQKAANSSMNACQLGQGLVDAALGMASDQYCKNGSAQMGEADNFSAARAMCEGNSLFHLKDLGFVKTVNDSIDSLSSMTSDLFHGYFSGSVNPLDQGIGAEKEANSKKMRIGNHAWEALKRVGIVMDPPDIRSLSLTMSEAEALELYKESIAMGELFMSAMNFKVIVTPETEDEESEAQTFSAQLQPRDLLGILECGTGYFNNSIVDSSDVALEPAARDIVKDECDRLFAASNADGTSGGGTITAATIQIYVCSDDSSLSTGLISGTENMVYFTKCYSAQQPYVSKINLAKWAKRGYVESVLANGTIGMAVARLYSVSKKIQGIGGAGCTGNYSISDSPDAGNTTLCPEEIALLENAPFPLYKVVNLAALYPALRKPLFDVYGRIMGLMMAEQYLMNYVRGAQQFATQQPVSSKMGQEIIWQLDEQITSIQDQLKSALDRVGADLERATILTEQINRLEQRLRNDIFNRQILGNQAFSQSVSTAAYP